MVMEVVMCFGAIVVVWISHWVYKWMNPKCNNGKLPPGSMGFPIIGETIQFFTPFSNNDIPPFFKTRIARYGSLFRTNIVGTKMIISTDPEINYSIFLEEGKSVVIWYTESFMNIVGKDNMISHHGMIHKYLRNLVLHLIGPENLRGKLLTDLGASTSRNLQSCAANGCFDVKQVTSMMIMESIAKKLMSYNDPVAIRKLKETCDIFFEGLISFPLSIPGTTYYKSMQARKYLLNVIGDTFYERKTSSKNVDHEHDYLDYLLEEVEKKDTLLTEQKAIELILLLLFASYETSSSSITFAMKHISDNPRVLAELKKEHETILRDRGGKGGGLTWEEYKSMTFTHMVINETMRLGNIAPGIIRKVLHDIEVNGYIIPANWLVMVVPATVHLNPDKYEDPLAFNPWRWEGKDLHIGSKTFMAFGGGARLCAGADFVKLQMTIFFHHLLTNYRWAVIKEGKINRNPGMSFKEGFIIEIKEKSNRNDEYI